MFITDLCMLKARTGMRSKYLSWMYKEKLFHNKQKNKLTSNHRAVHGLYVPCQRYMVTSMLTIFVVVDGSQLLLEVVQERYFTHTEVIHIRTVTVLKYCLTCSIQVYQAINFTHNVYNVTLYAS